MKERKFYKAIQVDTKTHEDLKKIAKSKGLTLSGMLKHIAEKNIIKIEKEL